MAKVDVGDLTNLFFTTGILNKFSYPATPNLTHEGGSFTYEGICNLYMCGSTTKQVTLEFPTPKSELQLPIVINGIFQQVTFNGNITIPENASFSINCSYEVLI